MHRLHQPAKLRPEPFVDVAGERRSQFVMPDQADHIGDILRPKRIARPAAQLHLDQRRQIDRPDALDLDERARRPLELLSIVNS